ncbi:polyketide synthase dehydratase domain-containing protein, partial [Streptomyces sp. T-3]|nr:polyketide synthase dehydratase domain-containing protein [Streptomyces sp. T-3]
PGGTGPHAAPTPGGAGPHAETHGGALRISTATMPYLLDHCFFQQPADWPDLADRWPVVPATTMVQLMIDAVPGEGGVAVAVEDARFLEWVVAEPAVDVRIETRPDGPGRYTVEFGRHARATVRTAATYETYGRQEPVPWPVPGRERQPTTSAEEMYDERWMFHGPLFRGVTRITALGDRHVRGVLTAPPAPGALLDNVGQLLGYWLMATRTDRTVVFPVGIKELRLHGPHPAPGTALDCHIRVTALTETVLEADVQLVRDGQVWAEIRGWQDRRFDSPEQTEPVKRKPAEHTLSVPQPGGWQLVFEYWPDPASRELFMRNQLAGEERTQYAEHPPRGKRQWLLGRIAAKDAVRRHLWAHGEEGPIYPSEVRVVNEPSGRPRPEGVHRRQLPPLELSLAHCREAAVSLVRPHGEGEGVGIDIEEIVDRPESTYDAVLAPAERALFREFGGGPEWLTRFWAAKEAAAKAEGTGLAGRPRDFTVVAVTDAALDVRTPSGRVRRVRHTVTANPPGLPARTYAVAWTVEAAAPDAPTEPADFEENTAP